MSYPQEYRYTEEHEWIKQEGNRATIGVTDHAQEELGDVVFVEFPQAGDKLQTGDPMATVESVKAVSDVFAPLDGTVVQVNDALEDAPETINQDPHGEGWIVVLEVDDPDQAKQLMDADSYEKHIAEG